MQPTTCTASRSRSQCRCLCAAVRHNACLPPSHLRLTRQPSPRTEAGSATVRGSIARPSDALGVRLCQSVGDSARRFALGTAAKASVLCALCHRIHRALCRRFMESSAGEALVRIGREAGRFECAVQPRVDASSCRGLLCTALHCIAPQCRPFSEQEHSRLPIRCSTVTA